MKHLSTLLLGLVLLASAVFAQITTGGTYTSFNAMTQNPARIAQGANYMGRLHVQPTLTFGIRSTESSMDYSLENHIRLNKRHAIGAIAGQIGDDVFNFFTLDNPKDWRLGLGYAYRAPNGFSVGVSLIQDFIRGDFPSIMFPEGVLAKGTPLHMNIGVHKKFRVKTTEKGFTQWEIGFTLNQLGGLYEYRNTENIDDVLGLSLPRATVQAGASFQRRFVLNTPDNFIDLVVSYDLAKVSVPGNFQPVMIKNSIIGRFFQGLTDDPLGVELETIEHRLGALAWLKTGNFQASLSSRIQWDFTGNPFLQPIHLGSASIGYGPVFFTFQDMRLMRDIPYNQQTYSLTCLIPIQAKD